MKTRQVIKIGIDISMTVLLFILMAFHYVGLQWHEVTAAVMLVLFILHHILNGNWYRALGKGKYSSGRILFTIVDVVLLIDMFLLMFSGISMSRYVFRFLDIPVSKAWARGMHMTASYAGFLLMGFHIGLHYGMIVGPEMGSRWQDGFRRKQAETCSVLYRQNPMGKILIPVQTGQKMNWIMASVRSFQNI